MRLLMCRQVERQANRMSDMLQRLNVDTGKLVRRGAGAAYAEARDKCLNCVSMRECLTWLEAGHHGETAPSFCPSARLFDECRRPLPPDYQI